MAIADLANRTPAPPWQTCATCHALDTLPNDKAATLRELLGNPAIRYAELSTELAGDPDWQLNIHRDTLSRHARGQCSAGERLRK